MARHSKKGGRGRGKKRGYYWDGLQFSTTALDTTDIALVLVDATAQEFMPATLLRIRGHLSVRSFHATSNVAVRMKLLYVEVNDAGTMTGDHSATDTHEEDIAIRQLYTNNLHMPALDENGSTIHNFEVDVKAKLKLEPSGKKLLVLLVDASTTSSAVISGYLRCLLLHG